MGQVVIRLKQGDADTLIETITNLTSLSGYTAKMYIVDEDGEEVDTIDGTIDALTITYQVVNENSKVYTVGKHFFETKIWDTSDHVYTPSTGRFIVTASIEEDPS